MSVQSAVEQDTRGLRDMIYPPAVDVSTLSQGIANAINSANQAQQQQAASLFNNVSDGLLNNIATFMPQNYGGSSSSSGANTQPTIPSIPMDIDNLSDTRGRSRERTPRISNEDQLQSVSVKRRISTYAKKKNRGSRRSSRGARSCPPTRAPRRAS